MTYKSLMVAVDLSCDSPPRIKLAASLANRFDARLIGVAAELAYVPVYPDPPVADAQLVQAELKRVEQGIGETEAMFRKVAENHRPLSWRSAAEEPRAFVVANARAADLVVLGRHGQGDQSDWRFGVRPSDIVMDLGRPMLLAPPQVQTLAAKRIVIGWKNTREARRAVWDSLPLLRQSEAVFLICAGPSVRDEGALDVQEYLSTHGVPARVLIRGTHEDAVADELLRAANAEEADLIVAGAYGHNRMREWMLGGVTRNLLERSPICCLLAH